MKGVIMLEGPDAVGKTTLAEAIKAYVGAENYAYIHLDYIKDNREMWRTNYLEYYRAQALMSLGKVVVLDRGWISENVYSGVYRGGSKLAYDVPAFDRVMRRLCTAYVLCCPTVAEAVRRHAECAKKGRELYAPDERIARVAARFRDIYYGSPNPEPTDDYAQRLIHLGGMRRRADTMSYDVAEMGHDLPNVIKHALEIVAGQQATQLADVVDYQVGQRGSLNFVGHLGDAEFLFVGDRCNPKKTGKWPFVDYGASSRTMSKTLHALRFDETRAAWTNANDQYLVGDILEKRPDLKVIALGGAAHDKLTEMGANHIEVYHPSYVGRFSKHAEFLTQIKAATT